MSLDSNIRTHSFISWFQNKKLRTKLFISYISISLIAVLAFGLITYMISIGIYKDEMFEKSAQITSLVGKSLDENFRGMETLTGMLYSKTDTSLVPLTELLSKPQINFHEVKVNLDWELKKYYNEIDSMRSDFLGLYLRGMNGYIYDDFPFGEDKKYSEADDWYNTTLIKEGSAVFWGTHRQFNSPTGRPVITLSKLLKEKKTENFLAVILLDFDLKMVDKICKDINLGTDATLLISDQEYNIVYDSDGKLVMTKLDNRIAEVLKQKKDGRSVIVMNHRDYLVAFSTSELSGWNIISVIPVSRLITRWSFIGLLVLAVGAALVLILSSASYQIARGISNPLNKLLVLMKRIEQGDFSVSAQSSSDDEIGQLNCGFSRMVKKISELIDREYKANVSQKEAELKALLAQINPHFLYNTLEQIGAFSLMRKVPEIDTITVALARMLRYSIKTRGNVVALRDEIKHVEDYFSIASFDMEDKIDLVFDIPDHCLDCGVLKLSLQPLVENAVVHGFEKEGRSGRVHISAQETEGFLRIEIEDNGCGMDALRLDEINRSLRTPEEDLRVDDRQNIGIRNVNSRLVLFYGKEYGISIESLKNQGTKISVKVPAVHLEVT